MTAKILTDEQVKALVFENLQNVNDNGGIRDLLKRGDEEVAVDMIFSTDDFETTEEFDEGLDDAMVKRVAAAVREYRPLFQSHRH